MFWSGKGGIVCPSENSDILLTVPVKTNAPELENEGFLCYKKHLGMLNVAKEFHEKGTFCVQFLLKNSRALSGT